MDPFVQPHSRISPCPMIEQPPEECVRGKYVTETAIRPHSSAMASSMSKGESLFFHAIRKVSTMPIFASEPATTVRQRSPWLLPKVAYVAIFLIVALAAYGWRLFNSRPSKLDVPPRLPLKFAYTTRTSHLNMPGRKSLPRPRPRSARICTWRPNISGQQTVVAISLSNLPAETIVPIVNVVASAYSHACRAEWKLRLEQAYSAAQAESAANGTPGIRGPDTIRTAPRSPPAGVGQPPAGCAAAARDD